jgi:cation diffusion facilitator family transporter
MPDKKIKIKSMIITSAVLFVLAALKTTIGFLSNSSSVESDALQSSVDLIITLISLIGLIVSQRPPDKRFSYGYHKVENLITFIISLGIFTTVILLIIEGINRIINPIQLRYPFIAMGISAVSIIVSFSLGIYLTKVAKSVSSPIIEANAKDKISDSVLSTAVLLSIILTYFNVEYAEGIVTILISLLIARVGFQIMKESLYGLLDISEIDFLNKVEEIILDTPGVNNCVRLRMRKAGGYYVGDAEIVVEEAIDVGEAHEILENVIKRVKEEFPEVFSFVVEIEPLEKTRRRILLPLKDAAKLESQINDYFKNARNLMLVDLNLLKNRVEKFVKIKNPFYDQTAEGAFKLAKLIEKENIDTIIVRDIGEIAFNQSKAEKAEIFKTASKNIQQSIDSLLKNNLEELEKPTDEESI